MGTGYSFTRAAAAFGTAVAIVAGLHGFVPAQGQDSPAIWTVPEIGALPNNANGRLVRRGRDLITATYAHIGPEVADPAKRFAGNNLACGNCHLQAGTKKFGIPLFGLFGEFPLYSARLGAEITIEDRFNSCMTRSMNGRLLPLGWAKFLWYRRKIDRVRVFALGVKPEYQHTGVGAKLYEMHWDAGERTQQGRGETGWTLESNTPMNRAMERMGGKVVRTYRLYERIL